MALMAFREPNQVKWIGTRPAHRGTQITQYATADNAVTIIYTVPAGKVLYLVSAVLSVPTGGVGRAAIYIRDALDASTIFLIHYAQVATGLVHTGTPLFYPPVEVPAGYDIVVSSGAIGVLAVGSIFGWEE